MKNGEAHLVFNTTEGAKALTDSKDIRRTGLAQPHSVLYKPWLVHWRRPQAIKAACGGHSYGGAAAVLCKRRILRMPPARRRKKAG